MPEVFAPRKVAPFKPLPWHIGPWKDKSPVMLLTGSAGGGKSRVAAEKIHAFCLKYPGATGLVVRKNRAVMTNSTILFLERLIIGDTPGIEHKRSAHRFEYANGSILAYGGMADAKQREQIRSVGAQGGVDIAWMEEATAFTEDDYNELTGRMRGRAAPWRQIMLSTNPDAPSHWINQRLISGGEASVYYSRAEDNPYNPKEYREGLGRISGVLGLRLREGMWVQAEGVVYDDWKRALHYIEPFPIPRDWRRIRVVDFGYNNPFFCGWIALDHDDRMYLYRQIYMTRRLVQDHAQQINALSEGERIETTVTDHDAEDRMTLERYGIRTTPAYKDITRGIEAVKARLRPAGDGQPRLYIMQNSLVERDESLVDAKKPWAADQEFEAYCYPKDQNGKPKKEEPLKENDHAVDGVRYGVAYIDRLAGAGRVELIKAMEQMKPLQEQVAKSFRSRFGRGSAFGRRRDDDDDD